MNDLISRQAAIEVAMEELESGTYFDIPSKIKDLPSAQPERKQGEWIYVRGEEAGNALYMCSECGKGDIHAPEVRVSYCWNCGAEMRGAEDE